VAERKSPGLEALLDALSTDIAQPGGMSRTIALEKRHLLTAWCQACQDEFYG